MDELLNQISTELSKNDLDPICIGDRSRLRLWSEETGTENQQTLHICNDGRENQRILPLPKEILRTSRHTDHLSRENRPNTDTKRQYG